MVPLYHWCRQSCVCLTMFVLQRHIVSFTCQTTFAKMTVVVHSTSHTWSWLCEPSGGFDEGTNFQFSEAPWHRFVPSSKPPEESNLPVHLAQHLFYPMQDVITAWYIEVIHLTFTLRLAWSLVTPRLIHVWQPSQAPGWSVITSAHGMLCQSGI